MRQQVTVLSVSGDRAVVVYDRPTACHNDCAHCQGGCGATAAHERITVDAENPIGARAGDRVIVETETKTVAAALLVVYALPLALFFAGYFLAEALRIGGTIPGILGFFLGVLIAVLASRSRPGRKIRFRIVEFV